MFRWKERWPKIVAVVAVVITVIVVYFCWYWPVTTVMVIRHAEPAASPPGNPPLSPAGQTRAQTLVHVAGSAGVSAIFASEFLRTQETVQPLATALGLSVVQVNRADVQALVDQILTQHRGAVVLVAGHTDTIPQIIDRLGGGTIAAIAPTEFDNLFVVTVRRFTTRVLRLKYGNAS